MRFSRMLTMFFFLAALLMASSAWAIRIICPKCNFLAELTDVTCKKCNTELNKCLRCGTMNQVGADFCEGEDCAEPLAEMRVLGQIDEETRKDLRLGQSERAQLDRELQSIDYRLEKDPTQAKKLLFRRARIFQQMDFPAKEAVAWKEYLEKFPDTRKKPIIVVFFSEALRKWGYLFYMQDDKETALAKFEAAVEMNPANAEAWLWVGRLKGEAKENTASANAYMKALEADPGNKTAISFLRKFKRQIPAALLKPAKKAAKPAPQKAPIAPSAPTAVSAPATQTAISPDAPSATPAQPSLDNATIAPQPADGSTATAPR